MFENEKEWFSILCRGRVEKCVFKEVERRSEVMVERFDGGRTEKQCWKR